VALEVTRELCVRLATPETRTRILGKVASLHQSNRCPHVFAAARVDQAQEPIRVGDLISVVWAHPLEDAKDLNVLATLEHRGGDEQTEESTPVTCSKCAAVNRERSDAHWIAEHLDNAWIGHATEVLFEVPANHGLRRRDLVRAGSPRT